MTDTILSHSEIKQRLQALSDDQAAIADLVNKLRSFVRHAEEKEKQFTEKHTDAERLIELSTDLLVRTRARLEGYARSEAERQAEIARTQADLLEQSRTINARIAELTDELDHRFEELSDEWGNEIRTQIGEAIKKLQFVAAGHESRIGAMQQEIALFTTGIRRRVSRFRKAQQLQVDNVISAYEAQRTSHQSLVLHSQELNAKLDTAQSSLSSHIAVLHAQEEDLRARLEAEYNARAASLEDALLKKEQHYLESLKLFKRRQADHWFITLLLFFAIAFCFWKLGVFGQLPQMLGFH